jgi:hypothetical protein
MPKKRGKKKAIPAGKENTFQKQAITELESDTWTDGAFASKISLGKSSGGQEGIKIRTAKRTWRFNEHRYGIWLPKGINLTGWVKWALVSIKKYSRKFWGMDLDVNILEEEVSIYKEQVKTLEGELEETRLRLNDTEELLRIQQEDRERAEKLVSKIEEYEKELAEFIALLDDSSINNTLREKEVKKKIKENRWFLGLECEIGATEKQIDIQTAIDLHLLTDFNQDKIFEFKSPNLAPFQRKHGESRLYIKPELSEGMHQLIIYMRKTNLYSFSKEEGTYGIRGPSGYVVIGYKIDQAQKEAITDWNFHLRPHIVLLTYDDLVNNAKRQLQNIKNAREVVPK